MKRYDEIDFHLEAADPEEAYIANKELNLAWNIVEETGENLFLTGRAGTGKTTFLKRLRSLGGKRMVVLAPTGVAAINAHGNTIHSFFQMPLSPFIPGKGFVGEEKRYFRFNKSKRRLIASLSLLVIDEVSMVRPDILDGIDHILRKFRNPHLPFGGIQLLLIGDLRQLPPVMREHDWEILSPYYKSPYFFESKALQSAAYQTIELTNVYRQSDRRFIELLNNIREGKADVGTLTMLNARYMPGFNPDDSEGYIRLTTHNRKATEINNARLATLAGSPASFQAVIEGEFGEGSFPADFRLDLKPGAQVMFIKNDTGLERRYYNGLIAKVTGIEEDSVTVRPMDSDSEIKVEYAEWENTRYVVNEKTKEIDQEVVGVFKQLPLRLAWAITIHKSQGLTFDKAIIDAARSFAAGQTYVALSRCKSLEGLVLDSMIPQQAVLTDSKVNDFVSFCERNAPDDTMLQTLRGEYVRRLLYELFDFADIKIAFDAFGRYVGEYLVPLYYDLNESLAKTRKAVDEMEAVGKRFLEIYARGPIDPDLMPANRKLLDKIKSGCNYFIGALKEVTKFINRLPRDIDNRAYAERLNNTGETLNTAVRLRIGIMAELADKDFSRHEYLNAKAVTILELEGRSTVKSSRKPAREKSEPESDPQELQEPKKAKAPKKPKGYSTFETLRMYQAGKDIEEIARERNLSVNTIAGHLSELVKMGRLKIEEIIDTETLKRLQTAQAGVDTPTFSAITEFLMSDSQARKAVPPYLVNLYLRATSQNK